MLTTSSAKPHIRLSRSYTGAMLWVCIGPNWDGYGTSPRDAYMAWCGM